MARAAALPKREIGSADVIAGEGRVRPGMVERTTGMPDGGWDLTGIDFAIDSPMDEVELRVLATAAAEIEVCRDVMLPTFS